MNIDNLGFYFEGNLQRVNNLLDLHCSIASAGKGRKSANSLDILRVSVVLLHSTMEDFLRSLLKIRLPHASAENLNKIPLFIKYDEFQKRTKFDLGELSVNRSKTVNELIELSVEQYLDRQSYNNSTEIIGALKSIQITVTPKMANYLSELDKMISRRHNIVHQADKEIKTGTGYHITKSISIIKVRRWIKNVDGFVNEIVKQM